MAKIKANDLLNKGSSFVMSGSFISLVVLGVVGVVGYKLYSMFFATTPAQDAAAKAATAAAADLKTGAGAQATVLQQVQSALSASGVDVGVSDGVNADAIYAMVNNNWVDDAAIIAKIQDMDYTHFKLMCVAYGQRNLNTWHASPAHLVTGAAWTDIFSTDKLYGTLKYHLGIVLTSAECSEISDYLDLVP